MGTEDIHRDTHRGVGYNSMWAVRFTPDIKAHKQKKTRTQSEIYGEDLRFN